MERKVLVTYASVHGATKEVAETVSGVLRDNGLLVDLVPMRSVRSLKGYSAVVLGAPIYMGKWHQDALRFLAQHHKDLASSLPAAVFAGGPIDTDTEEERQEVRANLDQILEKFPWFAPVSKEIIGGRFDPANLRFPYSLIPAMRHRPAVDFRDWVSIRAWAGSLPECFSMPNQPPQPALSEKKNQ